MNNTLFEQILDLLSVRHTRSFTESYYDTHPHKLDLLGLSEMLNYYGVETSALQLRRNSEYLCALEAPFVAFIDHEFVLVRTVTPKEVSYDWQGQKITLTMEQFLANWSGVVLLFEATEHAIEPDYKSHRIALLNKNLLGGLLGIIFLLLVSLAPLWHAFTFIKAGWLLLHIVGLGLGLVLLSKELTGEDRYVRKICSLFLKSSDCNQVLNTSASRFMGVSWSVVGTGFFLSGTLLSLFFPTTVFYSELMVLIALPYTLWSVGYQAFRVKQRCSLCLSVQALLWLMAGYAYSVAGFDWSVFYVSLFLVVGASYLLVILLLHFGIILYQGRKQLWKQNNRLEAIRLHESVYAALSIDSPCYEIDKSVGLLLGNRDAKDWITIVSNPHCAPCARLHPQIEALLRQKEGQCGLQLIFTSFSEELEPSAMLLIAMYQHSDETDYMRFLSDWYREGRHQRSLYYQRYQLDQTDRRILEVLEGMKSWVKQQGLTKTPTVLLNGTAMPEDYELKDLSYFINQ